MLNFSLNQDINYPCWVNIKPFLALLLLIILVPLTLLMTLGLWVPTLAGIWLPLGTRIALDESPRITRKGLIIPDLRYLVGDCQLAHITNASLSHPSRWLLNVGTVELEFCLSGEIAADGAIASCSKNPRAVAVHAA